MEVYKNLLINDIDGEIWKVLVNDNNDYSVSNLGRVKSLSREKEQRNGKIILIKGRILKQSINRFGYLQLAFIKSGKLKSFRVNRLVSYYFIENKYNLKQVNHIDGIKTNNKLENLEWVSNMENSCHRFLNTKKASKFIGVSFCKELNKWRAKIYFNGKQIHLGVFKSEIEAHLKRVEFEKLNNIKNKYCNY
jgi:hypothetical protein